MGKVFRFLQRKEKWRLISFFMVFFPAQEEYDEDEEELPEEDTKTVNKKIEHALEEEDPEVIKDLISLIKKVGGLDELEKQLQMRLNQNTAFSSRISDDKSTTTTVSPISQSLYNKVLGTKRPNPRTQKVVSSSITQSNTESEIAPLVQRQNKENRYSSVFRNSRPRPQNDGLDKLPEVEGGGVIRERPQYTTITRTQAPKIHDSEEAVGGRFSVTQPNLETADGDDSNGPTTHQPVFNYVNIQRARPSSTVAPAEDSGNESDDEEEEEEQDEEKEDKQPATVQPTSTSKMHYVNIQRIRPTKQQYISDEIESETPAPETK